MNILAHSSPVPHVLHASDFIITGVIMTVAVIGLVLSFRNKG